MNPKLQSQPILIIKLDKPCPKIDKWCRLFLKYSFYFCDHLFTSFIINMKITSAIYLVFTATLFLLLPISCLYRDCIDRLTKYPLIAFKLPDVGGFCNGRCDFCNCRDAMHCISTYPQLRTYTYLHPGTIATHVRGVLSGNKTDFYAFGAYAVFCVFILLFCLEITISTRKTKADLWQNKPCVLTNCLLDKDATSTG